MTAAQRRLNTGQSGQLVVVQTDTTHIVRPYTNTPSVTTLSADPVGNTSRDVMDTSHWKPELSMKDRSTAVCLDVSVVISLADLHAAVNDSVFGGSSVSPADCKEDQTRGRPPHSADAMAQLVECVPNFSEGPNKEQQGLQVSASLLALYSVTKNHFC
ncbi:hypothetical protein Q5P01_000041 [Channa striata]|uniref:Uncharacterized protein n=1 Tax=Channa striata TaxID=64152 RepID=A0AA88LFF1_CHASR|nr:hypothetical protein Q5P01_000041 [Channa striata]